MSVSQTDAVILSAFRVGLADIRRNQYLIDDIMSQFSSDPYLKEAWGQQQIDRMKSFVAKQKINIMMETKLPDTSKLPAIIVKIGGGTEDPQKQGLGDSDHYENIQPATTQGIFPSQLIVLGPVTPISYDSVSGQISFDPSVDLTAVFEGQFVFDEVNKQLYEILVVLDDHTIMIDSGLKPNLQGMTIRPQSNLVRNTLKSIWCYENFTLTCISTEPNELMFLYSLVIYILGRYKKNLFEARNFQISTMSYSEIYLPNPGDETNILFARDVSLRGRVEHSFISSTDEMITGISPTLYVEADDKDGAPIEPDTTTPALYNTQVSNQNWAMSGDVKYKVTSTTEEDDNN